MINHTNSPNTAIAIGAAMEQACVSGDLEVAERLFESYRLLFDDYQLHRHLKARPLAMAGNA
jgi:hypothetical protein